ncbi:unnamed protein product [Schistosoma margrebowiei]|uniref:Prolactin regulatory element-binding protein n=1 Tax=Schistosoma margrebowiei TaxID=48269 RepID=A0A3P8CUE4_9TREM|nr:unnamed protein product [Schistosoma margrebowiei]
MRNSLMENKTTGFSALGFPYPLYVVDVLDRNSLVVAGGGGSVKTGVPNRIDIINLYRNGLDARTPVDVQKSGGLDTGTEAVMNLTVVNPGDGGFIASLEGRHRKDDKDSELNKMSTSTQDSDKKDKKNSVCGPLPLEWELTKVREYTLMEQISCSADDSGSESPSGSAPKSLSGMPTCVTHGGPAGTWLAIGSDSGSVFLINRHVQQRFLDEEKLGDSPYQSLIVYPDVSGGLSTGVCSMAFSHAYASKQDDSTSYPLLATICDRPDWSTLRVWCINVNLQSKSFLFLNDIKSIHSTLNSRQQLVKLKTNTSKRNPSNERGIRMKTFLSNLDNDNSFKIQDDILFSRSMEKYPYAIASCSSLSSYGTTPPPSPNLVSTSNKITSERSSDRSNYRFRHCQFMKYSLKSPISSNQSLSSSEGLKTSEIYTVESMLVTTIQPLCANRRSFSRLVVWSVPHPSEAATFESLSSNNIKMHQPIQLNTFAEITLPQGHLPACLAVHPSRSRGLIGVGTMEGRVDVYFLSPSNHCLINIYTLNNAHPIFVTALTFLREDSCVLARTSKKPISRLPLKSDSFDLVSVSVDRLVKWHHGPTYSTVGKLSHGIININNNNNVSLLKTIINPKTFTYIFCLFSILFLPILMVFLESMLSNFY